MTAGHLRYPSAVSEAVMATQPPTTVVGVLALQGAFAEHIRLLHQASSPATNAAPPLGRQWTFIEVRTPADLARCNALIIPGGESTTMSLVAARSGLLEPLRRFVKTDRRPVWGTCAGLILLAEAANRTKRDGQDLIGGLDVRVNRNHFGRQVESFVEAGLELPFLPEGLRDQPFKGVFIRAPVVERLLGSRRGVQAAEAEKGETVVAPSRGPAQEVPEAVVKEAVGAEVEVMARLPSRERRVDGEGGDMPAEHVPDNEAGDIVAVRQGNVFGTSFHPELTGDARIHVWWLGEVARMLDQREREPALPDGLS